ncbi:MAG: prolyl oligopeptidase family serine peptidase [Bdellovibrionales bacterium]|nr:prolyl oligopeptidase family serine peptidase [Bdellovibrionales bacterium]
MTKSFVFKCLMCVVGLLMTSGGVQAEDLFKDFLNTLETAGKNTLDELALQVFYKTSKVPEGSSPALSILSSEDLIDLDRNRRRLDLILGNNDFPSLNSLRVRVEGPLGFVESGKKYPVVFLLGGLPTGRDTVEFLEEPGENVVISFDYPYLRDPSEIARHPDLQKQMYYIPAQVATLLAWVRLQTWSDEYAINLFGVSLGGYFLPACQRFAQAQGLSINASVASHAGTRLDYVVEAFWGKNLNKDQQHQLRETIKLALEPYAPLHHLKYLQGKFLVLVAESDQLIPIQYGTEYFDALPEPKEMQILSGPHISTHDGAVVNEVIERTMEWLRRVRAIN